MRLALEDAAVKAEDIDYISCAANSMKDADLIETEAVKEVFGKKAKTIPASSTKSMLGETFSAAGVLAVAATVGAIDKGFIPPTINYAQKDPDCDLDCVAVKSRAAKLDKVVVNAFGPSGSNSCLVVSK
jgi:3-oxoacyl-[acyl-carrier-protein] synthase II